MRFNAERNFQVRNKFQEKTEWIGFTCESGILVAGKVDFKVAMYLLVKLPSNETYRIDGLGRLSTVSEVMSLIEKQTNVSIELQRYVI